MHVYFFENIILVAFTVDELESQQIVLQAISVSYVMCHEAIIWYVFDICVQRLTWFMWLVCWNCRQHKTCAVKIWYKFSNRSITSILTQYNAVTRLYFSFIFVFLLFLLLYLICLIFNIFLTCLDFSLIQILYENFFFKDIL